MYTISYDPLWKTLVDKHWNKVDLQKSTKLSSATIAKMTNGDSVTLDVIGRICEALECPVYDVVEILITPASPSTSSPGMDENSEVQNGG